ncbi:Homeodomain-like DNA binding domain-containing transcription factor [Phycomyces blakesleeanus]|uniref:Homeodomain-like DNA binding domain-containing transcription factor n=2 Tax=Phycomyces blakesleeanus TaxID=4837 RepID=A0A167L2U2_PHYB8|nr:Homeodomain-like DNA binding domain-containing transcription factor [Phycomyces blakesleeanus NRRL 1555(-)]OAD69459.1 Homeodomain-like DNA binding domain-containing transcription factor [Phycomyces blakesleeanus NRRL 1555(-)]|eukprot:XP_018287499.1 Homeodomain-like DNA binding domain-containing transcription factor [Phycomyces blakesleeanus NRRL 1555(-)]
MQPATVRQTNNSIHPPEPQKSDATTSPDQLNAILQSVRQQIEKWGEHAKWKIDLVLLDDPTCKPNNLNAAVPVSSLNPSLLPGGQSMLGASAPSMIQTQEHAQAQAQAHAHAHAHAQAQAQAQAQLQAQMHAARSTLSPAVNQDHAMHSPQQHQQHQQPFARSHAELFGIPSVSGDHPYSPRTHPRSFLTTDPQTEPISIPSTLQYPCEYATPFPNDTWNRMGSTEELRRELKDSLDRQRYLEAIIQSQAAQLQQQSQAGSVDENEQRLRYLAEVRMSHKDTEALARKLKRLSGTLQRIETMEVSAEDSKLDKETLLKERVVFRRKLHLAHLRLSARDAELDYLHEALESYQNHHYQYQYQHQNQYQHQHQHQNHNHNQSHNHHFSEAFQPPSIVVRSPTFGKQRRKGPPYLFQQQYSPKMRSDIRPHTLSALDSLGIVADQMLSDPDFNKDKPDKPKDAIPRHLTENETAPKSPLSMSSAANDLEDKPCEDQKRSKRSIDLANTLLSIPNLEFPKSDKELKQEVKKSKQKQQTGEPASKKARPALWTKDQDDLLRQAVDAYGTDSWKEVSSKVGRSAYQCRERWKIIEADSGKTADTAAAGAGSGAADARQSPSIAALLDSNEDMQARTHNSPAVSKASPLGAIPPSGLAMRCAPDNTPPTQHHYHPHDNNNLSDLHHPHLPQGPYRPPSPISTPKRWATGTLGPHNAT